MKMRGYFLIFLACLVAIGLVFITIPSKADAAPALARIPAQEANPAPGEALGYECGFGEQLPDWVLCLHGTVALLPASGGAPQPLADVLVTVSLGDKIITTTTQIHPGESQPSYGLDISSLEPVFLQPITVTIHYQGRSIQRQVTIFPDFRTQSQRFDIWIPEIMAFEPPALLGSLIDFASGGPVSDAQITLQANGQALTTTTQPHPDEPLPTYSFDWTTLGAYNILPGDIVTLTAVYSQDLDQRTVRLGQPGEDALQINFVTGWKCDDFDPIPRTHGGEGLPRTHGGEGLPDVACFWGYSIVDSAPVAGARVYFKVDGITYDTQTHMYSGELMPRFGVGVWGRQAIQGQTADFVAFYDGYSTQKSFYVALDEQLSQRQDLQIQSTAEVLDNFISINSVKSMAWDGTYLWAATAGGIVRWNPETQEKVTLAPTDGLVSSSINDIAIGVDGSIWIATDYGVSRYQIDGNPKWSTFTTASGLASNRVQSVSVANDGSIWFGTINGVSHFTPQGNPVWQTFRTPDGLVNDVVQDIAIDQDGSIWFGTSAGLSHYIPGDTPVWQNTTQLCNRTDPSILAVAIGPDGSIWLGLSTCLLKYDTTLGWIDFGYFLGLYYVTDFRSIAFDSSGVAWVSTSGGAGRCTTLSFPPYRSCTLLTTDSGLVGNKVNSVVTGNNDTIWFGTSSGISQYNPEATPAWRNYVDGFDGNVSALAVDLDYSVWLGTDRGLYHLRPNKTPEWETFPMINNQPVPGNWVRAIKVAPDGSVWIGTYGSGVFHYTSGGNPEWENFTIANGLIDSSINEILIAQDGSLWFGHGEGSVSQSSTKVSHYMPQGDSKWWSCIPGPCKILPGPLSDMAIGLDGSIWFTHEDYHGGVVHAQGGVSHYSPGSSPEWTKFTSTDGLASDTVNAVAVANDGTLWFATSKGVSHYVPGGPQTWYTYTIADGLAHNNVFDVVVDNDGSLWFSTQNGLSHLIFGSAPKWKNYSIAFAPPDNQFRDLAWSSNGTLWVDALYGLTHFGIPSSEPDLQVAITAPENCLPGEFVRYFIEVANEGGPSPQTTLTVTFPASITILSSDPMISNTIPAVWNLASTFAGNYPVTVAITVSIPNGILPGTIITVTASAFVDDSEVFQDNNIDQKITVIKDPDRADLGVSATGPTALEVGDSAVFDLWFNNAGGLDAPSSTLTVSLDNGLSFISASQPPVTLTPLTWGLGTLLANSAAQHLTFTVWVSDTVPVGTDLEVSALLASPAPESNPQDNQVRIQIATALEDARTLILIAPQRQVARYGASELSSRLYQWASHPAVRGAIVDIERYPSVQSAFSTWDANPLAWQAANGVAGAIKSMIDQYTIAYPNLVYIVIVGGDEIIPFYRQPDNNPTFWHEYNYRQAVPESAIRAALSQDMLLSDDFYANRTPIVPSSPFWFDRHVLYLPDFAIGRLAGTPQSILNILDAFLENDGVITLNPSLVGGDLALAEDLRQAQCGMLQADGFSVECASSAAAFLEGMLDWLSGAIWGAFHSNHFSFGSLSASQILNRPEPFDQILVSTIGCHGGLPAMTLAGDPGLAEVLLIRGGAYIASTAYAYGSFISIGYSEDLMLELTSQLLQGSSQEIGPALVRAKQAYYARRGWFDYLDEKVLLPMTLYGLPMLRVTTPDVEKPQAKTLFSSPPPQLSNRDWIAQPQVLSNMSFSEIETTEGDYFTFNGQVLEQEGMPVQPFHMLDTPVFLGKKNLRGVRLDRASYEPFPNFDPLHAQSWALSEALPAHNAEPKSLIQEWDRPLPFSLGIFDGLLQERASLNLVLGAYHAKQQLEILFHDLALSLIYSSSADHQAPKLLAVKAVTTASRKPLTSFSVQASDSSGIAQVSVIYDDGKGRWQNLMLVKSRNQWIGSTSQPVRRYFVQALDNGGNLTINEWQAPVLSSGRLTP